MGLYQFDALLAVATGYAFANAVRALLKTMTAEAVGFDLVTRRGRLGLLALPLLVMTGPGIVFGAAIRPSAEGRKRPQVSMALAAVSFGWALASGHLLLRLSQLVAGSAFAAPYALL